MGINSGVLTLTIDAQNGGKTGKIGSVTIYVTTDNYESFDLPLDLYAVDQIKPEPDGTITATPITYGNELSKSEISGKMKDRRLTAARAIRGGGSFPAALKPEKYLLISSCAVILKVNHAFRKIF